MILNRVVVNLNFISIHKKNYFQVAAIYREGIETNSATFETDVLDWEMWDKKYLNFCRIAIEKDNQILAWAALSLVSKRKVYKGVAEISVYVKASEKGKGLGKKVLQKLIEISEQNKIWSLQVSIFRENKPSLYLFKKCGFRVIGFKENIGQLNGVWKDNIILERRSNFFIN